MRLTAILVALGALTAPAYSHEWYDLSCCSGRDCGPVDESVMTELPDGRGYFVPITGEIIPYKDSRVRRFSVDGRNHRCAVEGPTSNSRTLCIYPRGSGS